MIDPSFSTNMPCSHSLHSSVPLTVNYSTYVTDRSVRQTDLHQGGNGDDSPNREHRSPICSSSISWSRSLSWSRSGSWNRSLVGIANKVQGERVDRDAISVGAFRALKAGAASSYFTTRRCTSSINTHKIGDTIGIAFTRFRDAGLVDLGNVGRVRVADEIQRAPFPCDAVLKQEQCM